MEIRDDSAIQNDISALKAEKGAAVLAHSYSLTELDSVADAIGGSLHLALAARELPQRLLVVCGVYFVAETVKLLNPDKQVVLAHPQARCPLTGQIYPGRVRAFKEEHPEVCVICSTTASAQVKAECDLCVTEDTAFAAVRALEQKELLFISDCNLGVQLAEKLPEKSIKSWRCRCSVLNSATLADVQLAREKWPGAKVAVNCGCRTEAAEAADIIGSTAELVRWCRSVEEDVIIADESAICRRLSAELPERNFHQLATAKLVCNSMKMTNLKTLERALRGEFGLTVELDEGLLERAARPLERLTALIGSSEL